MAMLSSRLPAPDPGGSYGSGQHENEPVPRVTSAFNTKEPSDTALVPACLASHYRHMDSRDYAVSLACLCANHTKEPRRLLWPSPWVPGACRSGKPAIMEMVDVPRRVDYPEHVYDKPGIGSSTTRRPESPLLVDEARTGHICGPKALTTHIEDSTSKSGWSELENLLGKYELCGKRSILNLPTSSALNMPEVTRTKVPGQEHAPAWLLAALAMMFFTRQSSNLLSVEPKIISGLPGTLALTAMLLTCIMRCVAAPKNNWSWLQQTSCLLEDPG